MTLPKTLTAGFALVALGIVATLGYVILRPPGSLLSNAEFDKTQISPNADGVDDVTAIRYTLARPARISIYLENPSGSRTISAKTNGVSRAISVCISVGWWAVTRCPRVKSRHDRAPPDPNNIRGLPG